MCMPRLLDSILVVDVSLTCWSGDPPPGQSPEIIEIGVCPVDIRGARVMQQHSVIIVPEISEISTYCSQVTRVHQTDLKQGLSFRAACELLKREYISTHRVWASYGNQVRRSIKQQCSIRDTPYPLGSSHINLKSLLAVFRALPTELSLPATLQDLNLPLTGARHRAADRAYNSAVILARLLMEHRMKLLGGTN